MSDVTIYEVDDTKAASNWGIGAIGVSPGYANAATRAAVYVKNDLGIEFDLLTAL